MPPEFVMLSNHLIFCLPLLHLHSVFPSSGSFPVSWLFASGGQSIGASASVSILPMNIQDWFPLKLTHEFSPAPQLKSINSLVLSLLYSLTFTSVRDYWKNHTFDYMDLCHESDDIKVKSLLFNRLCRFVIAFLPRSKHLLISWLFTVHSDFGAQKTKVWHCFHCFPIYLPWNDGTRCHDLSFWMLSFKPTFSLSSFSLKRLFSSFSLSAVRVVSSAYLRRLIVLPASWCQLVLRPSWHFL